MRVNIQFESTDADNEVSCSNVPAVMEIRPQDFRLVFVEDLSGDGKKTKSTMTIKKDSLRLTRTGELKTDFIFGRGMIHNSFYGTPYGTMPVTVTTTSFSHSIGQELSDITRLPDDFEINVAVAYELTMGSEEPLGLGMRLKITRA